MTSTPPEAAEIILIASLLLGHGCGYLRCRTPRGLDVASHCVGANLTCEGHEHLRLRRYRRCQVENSERGAVPLYQAQFRYGICALVELNGAGRSILVLLCYKSDSCSPEFPGSQMGVAVTWPGEDIFRSGRGAAAAAERISG